MIVLVPSHGKSKVSRVPPRELSPKVQLRALQGTPSEPRRANIKSKPVTQLNKWIAELHFLVVSRQPGQGISLQQSVSIRDSVGVTRKMSPRLVSCSVNVKCGKAEERYLLTGLHAVADIHCNCCKTTLGWKYVS